ncbi:SurA N-terminal domain-containing protein [Candidatus Woesearchaeota archaeon]|nr:SurA N-terminal domain-containing protein [Candidatus Woesearchaeota archaeon]
MVSSVRKTTVKKASKSASVKKVSKKSSSIKKSDVSKALVAKKKQVSKQVKKVSSDVEDKIKISEPTSKLKREFSLPKFNNYMLIVFAVIAVALLSIVLLKQYGVIGNKVAAVVNGDVITVATLEDEYSLYQKVFQITDQSVFSKQIMLSLLIDEKLLLQQANKLGIVVGDSELESYLDYIISQSPAPLTKKEFKNEFEKNNISYSHVRELYRKQLVLNELLNITILSKIEITEDEIRAVYEQGGNDMLNYDSVKSVIESQIFSQKKDLMYRDFVEKLRNESSIQNRIYSDLDSFAKCLSSKGVVVYGVYNDIFTKRQADAFGKSLQYLNYVECKDPSTGRMKEECSDMTTFPTWKISDSFATGFLTIDYLSDLTGCKLY